jgi:two-component system response regulator FixJ
MSSPRPNVALVDDDPQVHDSVRQLLKSAGINVTPFADPHEFLAAMEEKHFHCVLLDPQASALDGLDLQEALRERRAAVPVVVLTGGADIGTAVRAMKSGALDVVEKPFADGRLVGAVRHAVSLYDKWRRNLEERQVAHDRIALLTPREVQVLDLMVEGKPNRQIAQELGISPKTLDIHRANVMHKMQARTTADLVRLRYLDRTDPMGLAYLGN